jgi:predicted aspartyl protease
MKLQLRHNLPFTSVTLRYRDQTIDLKPVLIDTGSASTVFSADAVEAIGISPRPEDVLNKLRGIGGTEVVYARVVDQVSVDEAGLSDLEVEIGGMDYGFEIQGILGMDFLRRTGAVLDLHEMTLKFPHA